MTTCNTVIRSAAFGVQAAEFVLDDDDKPWMAWPTDSDPETATQVAWGASADEAIARWGALYHYPADKFEFAGREGMVRLQQDTAVEGSP